MDLILQIWLLTWEKQVTESWDDKIMCFGGFACVCLCVCGDEGGLQKVLF